MATKQQIKQVELEDVPHLYSGVKYYDGEICFVDNMKSLTELTKQIKVNFVGVVFCTAGSIRLRLDDQPFELKQNDALFINVHSVVSHLDYGDDFKCTVIAMTTQVELSFLRNDVFETFLSLKGNPLINFTGDEIGLIKAYYELARFKMEHADVNYGPESMANIMHGLILDLMGCIDKHRTEPKGFAIHGSRLYRRFMLLLAANMDTKKSVADFARELFVSPKYLTVVCKAHSGKNAGELITLNIVNSIKQQLLYSDKSVKEIANGMGFENLSYFGKYVRRYLGCSPTQYRKLKRNPNLNKNGEE